MVDQGDTALTIESASASPRHGVIRESDKLVDTYGSPQSLLGCSLECRLTAS